MSWPAVLPAVAWRGFLLCGFERSTGEALDLGESSLVEVFQALHPLLGLAEVTRWLRALQVHMPEAHRELGSRFLQIYSLRACDRLDQTMEKLAQTPREFQNWVDHKKVGPRDLAALLALENIQEFWPFLTALSALPMSKSEGVRALELGVELFLLAHPLSDLLPSTEKVTDYLASLEKWRRPRTSQRDEAWRAEMAQWPWPAQVQAQWQRVGDQAGLEIKIRTTSPQDFGKKLERLNDIRATWSCKI